MSDDNVDLYEILEISPNATQETIERVFHFLAQRYHPDRLESGNADKFERIVKARNILTNPEKRAAYDIQHKKNSESNWQMVEEATDLESFEGDWAIQRRILSIMYVKRKRDIYKPGVSIMQLEHLTGCPQEILEFHLWYLKEKGWTTRLESGLVAITADGIDKALADHVALKGKKLITDQQEEER